LDIGFDNIFASFVSLTVGALLGSEVTRYFYKPRVIVKYKDIDPLEDQTGVYWSIQVENNGRTVAKECIAVLTLYNIGVEHIVEPEHIDTNEDLPQYRNEDIDLETPRKQIVTSRHFRPLNRVALCWSKLGNPDVIGINPGINQAIDLCKFHKKGDSGYFIFPSEDGWRRVRVRLKPEKMKGYVLICPANEFPTRVDFELSVASDGNSFFKAIKPGFFYKFKKNKFD